MITEVQKKLIRERVKEVVGDGKDTLRSILTHLFERAEKGNRAYYELEDKWGYTGDFSPHDWGPEIAEDEITNNN